jgi:hypothetical protein
MNTRTIIENKSSFTLDEIINYLNGYTTNLNGLIEVTKSQGTYYENIVMKTYDMILIENIKN